jgi:5'-3' exoribonuclease 1
MGIPAYYSYLIKNYKKIIIKRKKLNYEIDNFYLDSNSIIYNALENMEGYFNEEFINRLIKNICLQIDNYIKEIKPKNLVYISFDGIAPFAKLKQQKERRFKSKLVTEMLNEIIVEKCSNMFIEKQANIKFDRTCITPGTYFMRQMDKKVNEFFMGREKIYNINKIIVSTSNERGEGEHKIFDYIRKNDNSNLESHVIYGLDADLIILCLNHMHISKNIYLFRETPEFIKSLSSEIEPGELYLMKIEELMYYILDKMMNDVKNPVKRIKDYVFIMFLLGNDFMPHFPSLNIRTHGIEMILETYKNVLGKKEMFLIEEGEIVWKHFRELIEELSLMELDNIKREYGIRNKREKKNYDTSISIKNHSDVEDNTIKKKLENVLLNLPIKEREIEKEIDPFNPYWEKRYYEKLFNTERNDENLKKICLNYIEGLEWNMLYYTSGCKNWKWKYKYCYPPLFTDLLKYIPLWGIDYISENLETIDHDVQLAYVLPMSSMYLLPKRYQEKIIEYKERTNDVELQWSFCRYFWESHIDFKMEKIEDIEKLFEKINVKEKSMRKRAVMKNNIEFIVDDVLI